MRTEFTPGTARDYRHLPSDLQTLVEKQMAALRRDLRHPSLRAKKYHEGDDVWQGLINRDYQFYFQIAAETYHILMIIPNPK